QIEGAADKPKEILEIAIRTPNASPICDATLTAFISILGSEASNLVLKVLATGGLYIGGGIPVHILPGLKDGPFLRAFANKGRFAELLSNVPVHVIVAKAALIGAAAYGLRALGSPS